MPTFTLRVRERFEAAHHLTSYRGAPEPVHGHSWQVEVILQTQELDDEGMGFDFVAIKSVLSELASRFHHRDLNATPPFDQLSPTTEHLARWFFDEMHSRLPQAGICAVTVWEGPDCSATYELD